MTKLYAKVSVAPAVISPVASGTPLPLNIKNGPIPVVPNTKVMVGELVILLKAAVSVNVMPTLATVNVLINVAVIASDVPLTAA